MPLLEDLVPMSKLPTPVAAALGLVPTVLDSARRLPTKAATLPVLAVSTALTVVETARKEYDELASRGERLVSQLRGESVDEPETAAQPEPEAVAPVMDVEAIVEVATELADAPTVPRDELPLPDYDHMTLGSLRGRLRTLTIDELVQVRDYEKAHAARLPVVTLLDNRIAKLATG